MSDVILAPGESLCTYNSDSKYAHIHSATSPVWQALNPLLRANKIEHLYLEYSHGLHDVAQALFESNSLKSITLKGMIFYGKSLAYMINMLAAHHPGLTQLTVRNYDSKALFPSSDGRITDALANMLLKNDGCILKTLQLEEIRIDEAQDEYFAVFCDALARTETLTSLRLVDVELSKQSTQKLREALLSNQNITTFYVSGLTHMVSALDDVVREKPSEPCQPMVLDRPIDDVGFSARSVPSEVPENSFLSGINMLILSGFTAVLGAASIALAITLLSGGMAAGVGLVGACILTAGVYGFFSSRQDGNNEDIGGGLPTPSHN